MRRRDSAALERTLDRRRREDAAPRLRQDVPGLLTLRLRFDDIRAEGRLVISSYVRPVLVANAPSHFEVRCMEPRCDGRHDLTYPILRALRRSEPEFSGQSNCNGLVADVPCDRTLGYVCYATYRG
jgi:hypothetical protein